MQLEQLERLRSEIPPPPPHPTPPQITHTSDSHQVSSQNKTKSKLQILKNCQKFNSWNFETSHAAHIMKSLDKMYKYEIDTTSTVGATDRDGRTDERTDGQMDGRRETNIPPTTSLCGGYKYCLYLQTKKNRCNRSPVNIINHSPL